MSKNACIKAENSFRSSPPSEPSFTPDIIVSSLALCFQTLCRMRQFLHFMYEKPQGNSLLYVLPSMNEFGIRVCNRVSQIFVKKLTVSGLIWFCEVLRVQWYHFSRIELRHAQQHPIFKISLGAENEVFNPLSLCGLKDARGSCENHFCGLKIDERIPNRLVSKFKSDNISPLLAKRWPKTGKIPDFASFLFLQKGVICYAILILRPDLESSD